jgi:uncharacterized protein (DUF58 family)
MMVVRVNPQLHRLLGIAAWALFLGVVFARAELVLMGIPALLAIFVGLASERSAAYQVAHEVSTSRLFEGEVLQVTITILGRSAVPCIEVLDPLASALEVVSDSHHKAFSLKAGETVRWTYGLRGVRRGHFTLGHLRVRIHGRAGLLIREAQHLLPKPCTIYPRITPLQRVVHPPHTQAYAGNYVASALGEGIEFGNIRPFAPGDRTKRINWRASLRLHDLYVNEYQLERNADVVLMLDSLASVGSPALNTLDLCVRAAASLAWAYVRRKDRVGLIEYGGAFRWLRPGIGRAHFQAILDHLLEADVFFSYVAKDLTLVPKRILPPRALIVALSPLVDERFAPTLHDLVVRGFPVVLLAISPVDVTSAILKPSAITDITCRLWALERATQIEELQRHGVVVIDWHPQDPLEMVLSAITRRQHLRRRAS